MGFIEKWEMKSASERIEERDRLAELTKLNFERDVRLMSFEDIYRKIQALENFILRLVLSKAEVITLKKDLIYITSIYQEKNRQINENLIALSDTDNALLINSDAALDRIHQRVRDMIVFIAGQKPSKTSSTEACNFIAVQSHLVKLPEDLLMEVLKPLTLVERLKLRSTCKTFKAAIDTMRLTEKYVYIDNKIIILNNINPNTHLTIGILLQAVAQTTERHLFLWTQSATSSKLAAKITELLTQSEQQVQAKPIIKPNQKDKCLIM
jgi:hypothetical protein